MEKVDCIVIGAGVIGLAVAARLSEANREVIIVEKNSVIGAETSSRNSEVIHAGIYYEYDSEKARMCVQGRKLLYDFCNSYSVPYNKCGKIIVATSKKQLKTINQYVANAKNNGVNDLEWLHQEEINKLEPEVKCIGGILSPSTGIIDSHSYMLQLQAIIQNHGGIIALGEEVIRIESNPNTIFTNNYNLSATWIINCGGLGSTNLSKDLAECPKPAFAKGHYFSYSGKSPFSRLVYPVAEKGGLGVHVTLDMGGNVRFGPDVHWIDKVDYSFEKGMKDKFFKAIKNYYPNIDKTRLEPSYTGVRPKIIVNNNIYNDFMINTEEQHGLKGRIDMFGIESPGLTSSLALAEKVHSIIDSSGY